jgi:hypothetical protein
LESSHTFGALKDRLSGEMRRGKAYPAIALNVKYHQSFHAAWSSPTASGQGVAVVNALAKAGIELGKNGSIFPRPKGKPRSPK